MKTIRIQVVDAAPRMPLALLDFVTHRYHFELVDREGDFVLHSFRGREVLKCSGTKIGFVGENLVPDFNISDYAMGFSWMNFGDRYFRLPLYRIWNRNRYRILENGRPIPEDVADSKSSFCSCVVSNAIRDPFLERAFDAISAYKRIDSGGRWRNNVGGPVKDKIEFCQSRKFALVCENSSSPGYVTEKIVDAMVSNAIPIYWGAPDVSREFNPRAFVNCLEFDSIESVVARVREIDQSRDTYLKMLAEPWFAGGSPSDELSDERISRFLSSIFDQPPRSARRANRTFWGAMYVEQERRAWFRPDRQAMAMLRNRFLKRKETLRVRSTLRDSFSQLAARSAAAAARSTPSPDPV